MLDDLKYIHQKDAQDALGGAQKQWQQLLQQYDVELKPGKISNIVFAGMGGSALAAEISKSWPGYAVPFEICRNYDIPRYVNEQTLFIASSYSGNTEETLSALAQAREQGASIVVISSGGKLAELAEQNNYPLFRLPSGLQPRYAVFYNLKAIIVLSAKMRLSGSRVQKELDSDFVAETAQWLETSTAKLAAEVPTKDNPAKQLAQEIMGNSAVIYSGPKLYPAAYKWKININENAKNVAWCNQLPEFNHNEFLGWTSHPPSKPYKVIDLRSNLENPRVNKRFAVTQKLLSGQRPEPEVVTAQGDNIFQQLLWVIVLGDFVSLYLALLNGLNPTPVDLIEKLKSALAD